MVKATKGAAVTSATVVPPKAARAKKPEKPSGLGDLWKGALLLGAIIGAIFTVVESLDKVIALSGWAKIAVDHWRLLTVDLWGAAANKLHIPPIFTAALSFSVFMILIALTGRLYYHVQGDGAKMSAEVAEYHKSLEQEPPRTGLEKAAIGLPALYLLSPTWWRRSWDFRFLPSAVLMLVFMLAHLIGTDATMAPGDQHIFLLGALIGFAGYSILPPARLNRLLWAVILGIIAVVAAGLAHDWLPTLKEVIEHPPAK